MRKRIAIATLLITVAVMLGGCFGRMPGVMAIPDNDSIGEPKVFEKDGIKLTLTDRFVETESEVGFDAYYTSDFCGVVVLKEDFTLEEGLEDCPIDEYINSVIENNGHKGVQAQNVDDLWFYVKDEGATQVYSYSYKGSDAFWIVQFICMKKDAPALEDLFYLWASSVEVR